jgi:hypothetical protein
MATNQDTLGLPLPSCKPGAQALIVGVILHSACILRDDISAIRLAAGAVLLLVPYSLHIRYPARKYR